MRNALPYGPVTEFLWADTTESLVTFHYTRIYIRLLIL